MPTSRLSTRRLPRLSSNHSFICFGVRPLPRQRGRGPGPFFSPNGKKRMQRHDAVTLIHRGIKGCILKPAAGNRGDAQENPKQVRGAQALRCGNVLSNDTSTGSRSKSHQICGDDGEPDAVEPPEQRDNQHCRHLKQEGDERGGWKRSNAWKSSLVRFQTSVLWYEIGLMSIRVG